MQLGTTKTIKKSCRFTPEEVKFIQTNFGSYTNNSFNYCLSKMIHEYYKNKGVIQESIEHAEKELKRIKEEIEKYEDILSALEHIKKWE